MKCIIVLRNVVLSCLKKKTKFNIHLRYYKIPPEFVKKITTTDAHDVWKNSHL